MIFILVRLEDILLRIVCSYASASNNPISACANTLKPGHLFFLRKLSYGGDPNKAGICGHPRLLFVFTLLVQITAVLIKSQSA